MKLKSFILLILFCFSASARAENSALGTDEYYFKIRYPDADVPAAIRALRQVEACERRKAEGCDRGKIRETFESSGKQREFEAALARREFKRSFASFHRRIEEKMSEWAKFNARGNPK